MFISLPAKILKISDDNFIEVQPMYIQQFIDEDGEWNYENLPPLTDVPLLTQESGDFFINNPSKVGDRVTIVFTNKDLYDYYQSAGDNPYIATITANNDINNCYALPFCLNKENHPTFRRDCVSIEKKDNSFTFLVGKNNEIQSKTNALRIGTEDASNPVARGNNTKSCLDDIVNHLNNVVAPACLPLGIVIPPLVTNTSIQTNKIFTND
jgi:hypothetical protein